MTNSIPNGLYKTKNGSTVKISGKYGGICAIDFDWLEEGGCIDCEVEPYPVEDGGKWYMQWHCDSYDDAFVTELERVSK